ncbi:fimbrillin family protein [Phocaeicola abscessus]|uniref:fimbrillin family protein n=1 Tax=Phocaeicola abscessus TaxID=555313 RepID=UPI0028EE058A|nr:fimbrillin family protein [Phocaeicola abscessus]
MKKNVLYLAAGLLALASCSQDETTGLDNGAAIGFRPSIGAVTRGPVITQSNLSPFKVTAYAPGGTTNLFTNLEVSSTDGVNWTTAQTYFWPTTGTLNFCAYAPATVTGATVNPTVQKIVGFTPATIVADQKDLVISFNTGTKAANEASGVAMNFKHALAQIELRAKCPNDNMKVVVKGVKICRIPSTADFTFPTVATTNSYTLAQSQWSGPSTQKDYSTSLTAPVTLTSSEVNITGANNFLLIPQQLTPWSVGPSADGAYLSVLCQIFSKDGSNFVQLYPKTTGLYAYSSVKINTNWQPGKKYIYTLNYCDNGGGGGYIDPNPTDPQNPSDPTIDPNPGTGGDPILGGPIKFTVTVDNWTDENVPVNM